MSALPNHRPVVLACQRLRSSAQLAAIFSSLGLVSVAQAQTRDLPRRELEEVIVTAQKRAERLQDVPVAVSAVNAGTLINAGQLRLEDYFVRLPGVSLTVSGNGGEPMIVMRGMVTAINGNPTAGIVVDEIPYGRSRSLSLPNSVPDIDPGELSRVEVLRGPQGTLYGASSIGGLLKFVTADPSTEALSGKVQLGSSYIKDGDDVGHNVRASISVPLGDTVAVRASGFTVRDPGYVDNIETGERDINSRESDGGRLLALWRPSEKFSLKLSAIGQESLRRDTSDSDLTLEPRLQRRELAGVGDYDRRSQAYSAVMLGTIGASELISATGYSIDERNNSAEAPTLNALAGSFFPGTGRASVHQWFKNEKFTQELRASVPIGQRLNWLVGLFYTDEKDQYRINVFANTNSGADVGLLIQNRALPATSFEERAAFTNLTVQLTDRWDVQFGGRYSENDQVFARSSVLTGANPLDASPNFFQTSRSDDDAFTYLVSSRFKISNDFMTYARVASGYRPGGPNFSCGVIPAQLCQFDSDSSDNYEIGVKGSTPGNTLSFDAAVYYIDWKDIQVGPLIFAPGITYITNGSRAKSEGVEFSFESKPLRGLTLSAWAVYNNAVLTEPLPIANGSTFIVAGTRLPFTARWTGSLFAEQEFPLSVWSGADGFLGADISYVGERPGTLSNTNMLRAKPGYTQINVHTGVRYGTWTVNALVNNVTDKRGLLRGGDDSVATNLVNYIQPRTFGLSVVKSF